ncbi:hypothetical protein MAE02_61760 [Microvirga aerophila]|uniref:Flavinylation-associated cytochrome domain-containing protein n=1 Tax=Microvirga aerophila TaxID=670291 RepID=A0A512C2P1_9HYPH|nr:hypothetical protein MAE02_61760 [Microvirga aerophila]
MFLFCLFLDLMAACLLLAALAYDWLGNAAHEAIGTVLFLLLIAHGIFNRRWYGTIAKGWREPRRAVAKTITLFLLMTMLALGVTSAIISQAVFSFLPLTSTPTSRQIHALVAYLALLTVGAHLGLHGPMIMGLVRRWSGVAGNSKLRTFALCAMAAVIAAYGIHSLHVVDVMSKLFMRTTLEFWDFETSTPAFFLHHVAIVGLCALLSYCLVKLLPKA